MTWLSRDPIISSGRRETSQTAALIPSWQVSAAWVRTTRWGRLRTFTYIWRERKTELQIFFILWNSLYFPKIVETMSFIPNALINALLWYTFHQAMRFLFPPLESEHECDCAGGDTSSYKDREHHHRITHFHLVLVRCPCLTQLPYCEEAQLAMKKAALMEKNVDLQLPTLAELPANSQHHLHLVREPLSKWIL